MANPLPTSLSVGSGKPLPTSMSVGDDGRGSIVSNNSHASSLNRPEKPEAPPALPEDEADASPKPLGARKLNAPEKKNVLGLALGRSAGAEEQAVASAALNGQGVGGWRRTRRTGVMETAAPPGMAAQAADQAVANEAAGGGQWRPQRRTPVMHDMGDAGGIMAAQAAAASAQAASRANKQALLRSNSGRSAGSEEKGSQVGSGAGSSVATSVHNDVEYEIGRTRDLAKALMDVTRSTSERWCAARQLGESPPLGHEAGDLALEWVQHRLDGLKVADCMVRLAVIKSVLDMGQDTLQARSADITPRLLELLGDRFPPVRRYAIRCLRQMGPTAVLDAEGLTRVALRDTHKEIRLEAVWALSGMGEGAGWQLLELLASDFWRVRYMAIQALGMLCDWTEAEEDLAESSASKLAGMLFETMPDAACREEIVCATAEALGKLQERAAPQLLRLTILLRDEESARIRSCAVRAVCSITCAAVLPRCGSSGELHLFVEKRNENQKVGMAVEDLLYLICRVLVGTTRDQGLAVRTKMAAEEFGKQAQELQKKLALPAEGSAPEERPSVDSSDRWRMEAESMLENLARQGERCQRIMEHVQDVQVSTEEAFRSLGVDALPSLCQYLLGEGGGFLNRMAVLRALHCTACLDEVTECAFLAEWLAGMLLVLERVNTNSISSAEHKWKDAQSCLPLFGFSVVEIQKNDFAPSIWAVLCDGKGKVILVMAANSMSFGEEEEEEEDDDELKCIEVDITYPRPVGPVRVHKGLWRTLESDWIRIVEALQKAAGESQTISDLTICGHGPGGALAELTAVKLSMAHSPLSPVTLHTLHGTDDGPGFQRAMSNVSGTRRRASSNARAPPAELHFESAGSENSGGSKPSKSSKKGVAFVQDGNDSGSEKHSSQEGEDEDGGVRGITTVSFGAPPVVGTEGLGDEGLLRASLTARCNPGSVAVAFLERHAHGGPDGGGSWFRRLQEALCSRRRLLMPMVERASTFGHLFAEESLVYEASRQKGRREAPIGSVLAYVNSLVAQATRMHREDSEQ